MKTFRKGSEFRYLLLWFVAVETSAKGKAQHSTSICYVQPQPLIALNMCVCVCRAVQCKWGWSHNRDRNGTGDWFPKDSGQQCCSRSNKQRFVNVWSGWMQKKITRSLLLPFTLRRRHGPGVSSIIKTRHRTGGGHRRKTHTHLHTHW